MHIFIDPRVESLVTAEKPLPRTTLDMRELTELHALCRNGRLYDIERWIASGRPLQAAQEVTNGRGTSALNIALEAGNHALALLLLANGYDANNDAYSPLDLVLSARRFDLLALLLDWGATHCWVSPSDTRRRARGFRRNLISRLRIMPPREMKRVCNFVCGPEPIPIVQYRACAMEERQQHQTKATPKPTINRSCPVQSTRRARRAAVTFSNVSVPIPIMTTLKNSGVLRQALRSWTSSPNIASRRMPAR